MLQCRTSHKSWKTVLLFYVSKSMTPKRRESWLSTAALVWQGALAKCLLALPGCQHYFCIYAVFFPFTRLQSFF